MYIFHSVFRRLHRLIVAYFLGFFMLVWGVGLCGCGFQADPYYGEPSTARSFNDLMALESKIE